MEYDFLDKCTKQELIHFIKNSSFLRQLFSYRHFLSFRKYKTDEELDNIRSKSIELIDVLDFAERDKLEEKFNKSEDIYEKLCIASQLKLYEIPFQTWIEESQAIIEEQTKLNKLYDQMKENRKGDNYVE